MRQVDAFPLYELTTTAPTPSLDRASGGGACTVFFAGGVLGRNFDFDDHPALLLHHRPPGAYKSVSLVDIAYLGVERGETADARTIWPAPPAAVRRDERARRRRGDGGRAGGALTGAGTPSARSA